jgi:hypothetical protein
MLLAPPAFAQNCDPTSLTTAGPCTIQQIVTHFHNQVLRNSDADVAEVAEANDEAVATTMDKAEEEVKDANRATTPPESFAARLHNSYEDFLNPLAFAINKIEESDDGQALTVRFNPFRSPGFEAGLTATIARPTLFSEVQKNIGETKRDEMTKKIEDTLGDFEDVTLAFSYSLVETKECKLEKLGRCWGRNPKIYTGLLSDVLANGALKDVLRAATETSDEFTTENAKLLPFFDTQLSAVGARQEEVYNLAKKVGTLSGTDSVTSLKVLSDAGIDNLATLIDNQPQLAGTLTYHHREDFTGPPELSATLEYQWGLHNLNSLKGDQTTSFSNRLATDLKKFSTARAGKVVLSLSYKRVDPYLIETLGEFAAADIPFTAIDIKGNDEFKLKAQYGWEMAMKLTGERPRLDFSTDFARRNEGGKRTVNRFVSTATFTMPYGNNMSIPISLKYANRPEDLQQEQKRLSVHFGLSYRLPSEMN